MKEVFTLILALVMAMSLVACGGSRSEESSGGDGGDDTVPHWADLEDGHTFNVGDRFSDYGKTYEVLRQFFKADSYRPPALIGDFYQLAE